MKAALIILLSCSAFLCGACSPSSPDLPETTATLQCFNAELYQTGNHYTMGLYLKNKPYASQSVTLTVPNSSEPRLVTAKIATNPLKADATPSQLKRTLEVHAAQGINATLVEQISFNDGYGAKHSYSPNMPQRFAFNHPKEQHEDEYQLSSTFFSPSDEDHQTTAITLTTQFVGQETVTTPAGKFTTCHFKSISRAPNAPNPDKTTIEVDRWYDSKLGVLVKLHNHQREVTQELLRANINGQRLTAANAVLQQFKLADNATSPQGKQ